MKQSVGGGILLSFLAAGVVSECSIAVCPNWKCDELVEADPASGKLECDVCDTVLDPEKATYETVYIPPQKTDFECGDVIPIARGGRPDVDGVEKIIGCSDRGPSCGCRLCPWFGWRRDVDMAPQGIAPAKFWPKWLGGDFPTVGIWSLGYKASSIGWKGTSMPLWDRAINVLAMLEASGVGRAPSHIRRPPSLGGLLVEQDAPSCAGFRKRGFGTYTQATQRELCFLQRPIQVRTCQITSSILAFFFERLSRLMNSSRTPHRYANSTSGSETTACRNGHRCRGPLRNAANIRYYRSRSD